MNISNMMNTLIMRIIVWFIPNLIQFVRLNYSHTSRNRLCLKTSIHLFDYLIRDLLINRSKFIASLTFLHRNSSHINTIHPIPICLCHILIAVNILCFRIGCINHHKLATLHPRLKHLEQQ